MDGDHHRHYMIEAPGFTTLHRHCTRSCLLFHPRLLFMFFRRYLVCQYSVSIAYGGRCGNLCLSGDIMFPVL